ncbi:MAG: nascent polypeptide-associated complex protein [Thermoplasmata archaeon]|nr:nascent polypeptide-associated complex protein [Thermoplasmata archaeon]
MMRINDRQLQRLAKQMGLKTQELDAVEVLITGKEKDYVVKNPKVTLMEVQGQKVLQIIGDISEKDKEKLPFKEEDIELVMQQTGVEREEAIKALKEANGEPAEAIISIMKNHGPH